MTDRLPAANSGFSSSEEDRDLLSCRRARPRDLGDVSYLRYRRYALFLKPFTKILLVGSMISVAYASSTLEQVSSVYRLKGPPGAPLSVRTETNAQASRACQSKSTLDLVLVFVNAQQAEPWIELENFSKSGPCEVKAYPTAQHFEMRLSYKGSSRQQLKTLSYGTDNNWIVDHWVVGSSASTTNTSSAPKGKARVPTRQSRGARNPLVDFSDQVLDVYQDGDSWNKILGQMGQTLSFESPELDRFRVAVNEQSVALKNKPRHLRPLAPPLLSLPMLDAGLVFAEESFELGRFERSDLTKTDPQREKTALEGLNYLSVLFQRKDWVKIRESMSVLERSNVKDLIPSQSARWWALKGFVLSKLGEELSNNSLKREALDAWREGLRTVAGRGAEEQVGADFMVLESLRELFNAKQYYAAAALLAWSQKYRWSPRTEERLGYLKAEAHYRMGLIDEAHEYFKEFVEARKDIPLSAAIDRRLMPLAAFRLGDAQLRQNRYKEAIADYTAAFSNIPTQQKLSFEGAWYPSELRHYPQVFFHRAEAHLRSGSITNALTDLRAFVNFASDHPNLGIVMYRIGDLLELVEAPHEKIEGAWRECVFRTGENLGGKLCQARQSSRSVKPENRAEWPKIISHAEDILKAGNLGAFEASFKEELRLYSRILMAHAFLRAGDPFQAYQQIELTRGIEGPNDFRAWAHEYRLSALAGYLLSKVDAGRASEVMGISENARKSPGLDEARPELIWPMARAYADLGLWKAALGHVEKGLEADAKMRPAEDRPYLPSPIEWRKLRAQVELRLLLAGDIDAKTVETHLKEIKTDGKDPELLRMWKDFYKIVRRPAGEAQTLAQLRKIAALSQDEWKRYFETLSETKKTRELRSELETYVGPWLSATDGRNPADAPSADIFFMLFEVRELQGDTSGAATVLNHLLAHDDLGQALRKEQLLYRQGQLRRREGRVQEARQSFEAAKALAGDSMWGRLSVSELQSL
jgi:tetratricopeptide (TPR) repeat protein